MKEWYGIFKNKNSIGTMFGHIYPSWFELYKPRIYFILGLIVGFLVCYFLR